MIVDKKSLSLKKLGLRSTHNLKHRLNMRLRQKLGAILWILSIQYFGAQFVVAQAWKNHFSLADNTISDLGNTACTLYGKMYICSPLHRWMNASFILLGIFQAIGGLLLCKRAINNKVKNIGFDFIVLGGIGILLVGIFPENTIIQLHMIGAALPFLIGNLGLIFLGPNLKVPNVLKVYTWVSGSISLVALILLVTHNYLSMGNGGMERLTAYPQTIWLMVIGIYILYQGSQVDNI